MRVFCPADCKLSVKHKNFTVKNTLMKVHRPEKTALSAPMRAINALSLANFLSDSRKISFDMIVKTMYETGRDLSRHYRETSEGGLAKLYMHE